METRTNPATDQDQDRPNRNIDESDESGIIESVEEDGDEDEDDGDDDDEDDDKLEGLDKTLADSFPASDPPAH